MRILIVSTYFPPQNSISSLRPYSWAKEWSTMGFEVTVLTVTKQESSAHQLNLAQGAYRVIDVDPPPLYRLFSRLYRTGGGREEGKSSSLKRLLKPLMALRARTGICNSCRMPDLIDGWARKALRAIRDEEPWDLVVSTAGPYATHRVAYGVKRGGQAKQWIADYRDLWVDSELFRGLFPFTLVERYWERKWLALADSITTVTEGLAAKLALRYPNRSIRVVENGCDPSDLERLPTEPIFPADGKVRIVYTGMIYAGKRDPSPLFAAIERLRGSPLLERLEVIFVGCLMANLRELIDRYDVGEWVQVAGFVSRTDALRMQRDANRLLFLEWSGGSALTGKLFEYLFSATPIWAIGIDVDHEAGRLIARAQAGELFGCDVDRIEASLRALLRGEDHPPLPCREVIEEYDRGRLASRLLALSAPLPGGGPRQEINRGLLEVCCE